MALTNATNRVTATGDNTTVTFFFNRMLYDTTHLEVYLDGVLQASGYSVTGVPGTSTSVVFDVAPALDVQVLLVRVVPLTQLSVYAVGGAFPAATTEKNFDLVVMGLQQFDEQLDRAIKLPLESTLTAADIPDPADPANYNLGLKIAGDGSGLDTFVINAGSIAGVVTTKGDILIFGASAVDRLAVGANDTLLVADSTVARGLKWTNSLNSITIFGATLDSSTFINPTLETPTVTGVGAGALTLIDTKTAAASATIDFTTGIGSTYDAYLVTITDMLAASISDLMFRISQDGGGTYKAGAIDYNWIGTTQVDIGAVTAVNDINATSIVIAPAMAAASSLSGEVRFYKPTNTTLKKQVKAEMVYRENASDVKLSFIAGNFDLNTAAFNAIRFMCSTGNITSGTFALYGIRKA